MGGIGADRTNLTQLWRAWNPRLVRYLSSRGAVSAEDLAADVWLDVARGLTNFQGSDERAWTKWLFTIARRRLIDEARAHARRPEMIGSVPEVVEMYGDPEVVVAEEVGRRDVISLIRRLPDDQADVILLRVVADLDVAGVAELLGRPPGTVRVLAHRGLRRLAELMPSLTSSEVGELGRARNL